jgi:hypothetical protein
MIEGTTTTEYALLKDSIVKEVMENEPPSTSLRYPANQVSLFIATISVKFFSNVFAHFRTYKGAT